MTLEACPRDRGDIIGGEGDDDAATGDRGAGLDGDLGDDDFGGATILFSERDRGEGLCTGRIEGVEVPATGCTTGDAELPTGDDEDDEGCTDFDLLVRAFKDCE